MYPHEKRNELERRVRAISDRVSRKIGVQIDSGARRSSNEATLNSDEVHESLVVPFRAWWDFDKPWRNKK